MKLEAQHKSFFKAADVTEEGSVKAAFAELDVVDHDGDITRPGAFPEKELAFHVQHDSYSTLPVGKGRIFEEKGFAIFDAEFNMDIQAGRDAHASVKFQGDIQQWSYGYFVLESEPGDGKGFLRELKKLDVYEVSAVTAAAGKDTRTIDVKTRDNTINLLEHLAEAGDSDAEKFLAIVNAEGAEAEGMKFLDAINTEAKRVVALVDRADEIRTLRSERGADLGNEALASLMAAHDSLSRLVDGVKSALDAGDETVDPVTELVRFERNRARLAGHIQ
jgi:HK97 family phage prohead protease